MKEQLIKFDTAKLAKEKGFDIKVNSFISDITGYTLNIGFDNYNRIDMSKGCYSAPTQSLLQKWLREVHFLWVETTVWGDGIGTQCIIKKADYKDIEDDRSRVVKMAKTVDIGFYMKLEFNYEKTLEKGLQEALKLI